MSEKDVVIQNLIEKIIKLERLLEEKLSIISKQSEIIGQQSAKILELEKRLNKNSRNSSKPPSSDGLKRNRTRSLRQKGKNKNGGQWGHKGETLRQVETPDKIERHALLKCPMCSTSLESEATLGLARRQVFDIPPLKAEITEHQAEIKLCNCCGKRVMARFPEGINSAVQYGDRIRSTALYMLNCHYFPLERLKDFFLDVFHIQMSEGTLVSLSEKLDRPLDSFVESVRRYMLSTHYVHADETGFRVLKKLHWLHVISTSQATLFQLHEKRGIEGMKPLSFYEFYTGHVVHDHWHPYFRWTGVTHVLCNAHHLRELRGLIENEKEVWAEEMQAFLCKALRYNKVYRELGKDSLPEFYLTLLSREYDEIIASGLSYHQNLEPVLRKGKRGRFKQRVGKNLLDRFLNKKDAILRFLYDLSIPFTNNQAERDIRMMKLQQKISGCFRTLTGAELFVKIRSYISTAKKQRWDIIEALNQALQGTPMLLEVPE
jgi:transposase